MKTERRLNWVKMVTDKQHDIKEDRDVDEED